MTQVAETRIDQPSPPQSAWTGRLALALAAAGMILICLGDPYWLAMPSSAAAVFTAWRALRRDEDNQVAAHIGLTMGLLNLFLWLVLILFMQTMLEMNISALLEVPSYDAH